MSPNDVIFGPKWRHMSKFEWSTKQFFFSICSNQNSDWGFNWWLWPKKSLKGSNLSKYWFLAFFSYFLVKIPIQGRFYKNIVHYHCSGDFFPIFVVVFLVSWEVPDLTRIVQKLSPPPKISNEIKRPLRGPCGFDRRGVVDVT